MKEDLVAIAKIVKCQGLKGEVKLLPFIMDLALKGCKGKIYTIDSTGEALEREPELIRPHKNLWVIRFKGINSINEAQSLIDQTVAVDKSFFPELSPGNYYWFEILGLEVYDEENTFYGEIEKVFSTGSNDVYVVKSQNEDEFLLPATKEIVKKIDLKRNRLIFTVVEGLLENLMRHPQ